MCALHVYKLMKPSKSRNLFTISPVYTVTTSQMASKRQSSFMNFVSKTAKTTEGIAFDE